MQSTSLAPATDVPKTISKRSVMEPAFDAPETNSDEYSFDLFETGKADLDPISAIFIETRNNDLLRVTISVLCNGGEFWSVMSYDRQEC